MNCQIRNPKSEIRNRNRAFTLLEILIATTAFAIVLTAINGIFYGALRLRNASVAAIERSRPLERTVAVIKRDLAALVLPGGTLAGALQTTSITNLVAGQASPEFFTASGVIDETSPWADVQKVSYALMPSGTNNVGLDLFRTVTRNLLAPISGEPPALEWLMGGVQNLTFTFWDGSQWRASWDTTIADFNTGRTNIPPQAIKVQIQLASQATDTMRLAPVEIVVPIAVQATTNQVSGGGQ